MLIKLNIDTQELQNKPHPFDGRLRNRLCSADSIREVTPDTLIKCVQRGRSFTPAVMTGTTGDTWQSQQVICADIDNDSGEKDANKRKIRLASPLTPERAREVMAQYGIDPYFMYYSFSNADDWPKFRIVLILDAPITDHNVASDLTQRFTGIFNKSVHHCADTAIKDNARLYYGGKVDSVFYTSGQTTSTELLQALPVYEDVQPSERAEKPAEAVKTQWEYKSTTAPQNGAQRPYNELQAQFEADKESFNLAEYVQRTTNSSPVKIGRNLFFNPCPICGHNDDFQITGSVYHCHSASGGTGGSIIDFLMNKDGLDMGAACDKFKYDIMKYNREEWRQAYITDKYPVTPAENGEKRQTDAPTANAAQDGQNAQPAQPLGLLTLERAISILEAVDDHYLEMPHFKTFCDMVKLKTHDTIVIAADTGAGKSSLALNFLHELQDRYPALYVNLEMDEATILQRLVAIHTGIELDRIEGYKHDANTRAEVNAAIAEITARKEIRLLEDIYDLKEIEKQIQAATAGRKEPTMVFVDTGLLVTLPNKNASRYERFTQISEELRRISRLNNVVMFVLLQMNREGKKGKKEEPTNSSLKESGSWENDATKIMFLWENPQTKSKEILVTKNRNGRTGSITLDYSPRTQTYKEGRGLTELSIDFNDIPTF